MQIALGTGPGWAGSGGPWVKPELSMQHLVSSETTVSGPMQFDAILPRPKPRTPFFGEGSMTETGRQQWRDYYRDEIVLAFPTPAANRLEGIEQKALYSRAPYTSGTVAPRIPVPATYRAVPADATIATAKIVDLTAKLGADGRLNWQVPAGNWTIMRFGRTTTGQTTRPAPGPGLGFESDKFSQQAVAEHLKSYTDVLLKTLGPNYRKGDSGLTYLHFDSWEMSAQNWTQGFKNQFIQRRGYDPTPYLPVMSGYIIETPERSERFLWDLRQTASELVIANHAQYLKQYAHQRGLGFSVEPYDMNPSADLDLGAVADLPMCEFWSRGYGFRSEYSCFEAVSVAHTNGLNVIGAESFTSDDGDAWLQHPGSMKNQLDWALCNGINKFVIHRYQHQPTPGQLPGMAMGPYGVHWEATQTWWDMVSAFHQYMTRTSEMLRQGAPVADVLYLTPEGAPQVFTPPPSALMTGFPDHKGYSFDGCSPKTLIEKASVKNGLLVFPQGVTYKILVLPSWETMTPQLLRKITALVEEGATVVGAPPLKSPSLSGYPASDTTLQVLSAHLWGRAPFAAARKVGKGRVFYHADKPTDTLQNVPWIWARGGEPSRSAPVETLDFTTDLTIAPQHPIAAATANFTADNNYELFVNGRNIGGGDDFHYVDEIDVTDALQSGRNEIRIRARNIGDAANPAGLLGALSVTYRDGTQQMISTDASWRVARTNSAAHEDVAVLGARGMAPWGEITRPTSIYPSYQVTAALLRNQGIAPDFTATLPMRFIHRKLNDGDLYFVGNISAEHISATATFRSAGRAPEWWNPVTGESRTLSDFSVKNGLTSIPLRLAGHESGFVIFRQPLAKISKRANFPTFANAKTLDQPWQVSFDEKWGAPGQITFATLDDWSQRPELAIKYYSGKATYRTTFAAPIETRAQNAQCALNLGVVKNMAMVKLNGRDLGVVWTNPWQVKLPAGLLKPTGNQLEITVANLWANRLIGDAKLPEAQRQTVTTHRPYGPNSPLLPSGLLGPVTIQIAK